MPMIGNQQTYTVLTCRKYKKLHPLGLRPAGCINIEGFNVTMSILPYDVNYSQEALFGASIENWTRQQLAALGYEARPLRSWCDRFDILITGDVPLLIECKAAHETRRKVRPGVYGRRWQFATRNRPQIDHIVILAAVDDYGKIHPFVCPSWLFFGRDNVAITSHPLEYVKRGRGMFSEYYQAWGVIEQVMSQRAHVLQLPLFDLVGGAA